MYMEKIDNKQILKYVYTRWPILIYNPKYLLKYFIYVNMVRTKVDQDRGGHLTNFDLEVNFQGQMEVRHFS